MSCERSPPCLRTHRPGAAPAEGAARGRVRGPVREEEARPRGAAAGGEAPQQRGGGGAQGRGGVTGGSGKGAEAILSTH
jgi:hypothetical protein